MIWNYFTLLNCFQTNAFNANYVILEACLSTRNQRFPACHVLEAMIAAVGCVIQHNVKYPGFRGCACPHQTILNSNFAFLEHKLQLETTSGAFRGWSLERLWRCSHWHSGCYYASRCRNCRLVSVIRASESREVASNRIFPVSKGMS